MPQKGSKIGKVQRTLGIADSKPHRTTQSIPVSKLDVSPGETYIANVAVDRGPKGASELVDFETTVTKSQSVSLPTKVIREYDEIEPGRSVILTLYEIESTLSDDAEVIDRAEAVSGGEGIVDSRLFSKRVCDYLGNTEKRLRFRNTRTALESEAPVTQNQESNAFTFPKRVRDDIDVQAGDLIEIIGGIDNYAQDDEQDVETAKFNKARLEEMHRMVTEMYGVMCEAKDG